MRAKFVCMFWRLFFSTSIGVASKLHLTHQPNMDNTPNEIKFEDILRATNGRCKPCDWYTIQVRYANIMFANGKIPRTLPRASIQDYIPCHAALALWARWSLQNERLILDEALQLLSIKADRTIPGFFFLFLVWTQALYQLLKTSTRSRGLIIQSHLFITRGQVLQNAYHAESSWSSD